MASIWSSAELRASTLMWTGSKILCRAASPLIVCSPSVLRRVERQCRQVRGVDELRDRAEERVLLLGRDLGRRQLVLVVGLTVGRLAVAHVPEGAGLLEV